MKKYLCIKNFGIIYLKGNYYNFYIDISPSEYKYYFVFDENKKVVRTVAYNDMLFPINIFNDYFISVKEIRKQKLEKLNEKN